MQQRLQLFLSALRQLAWPMVLGLRANPLGPALTVCSAGFFPLFVLPFLTMWILNAPKLVLAEVLLSAPFVPYAVYRVHQISWKPMAGLWAFIYILGLVLLPASLRVMPALAISAHMTVWFLWGCLFTGLFALYVSAKNRPSPAKKESIYDKMASDQRVS